MRLWTWTELGGDGCDGETLTRGQTWRPMRDEMKYMNKIGHDPPHCFMRNVYNVRTVPLSQVPESVRKEFHGRCRCRYRTPG